MYVADIETEENIKRDEVYGDYNVVEAQDDNKTETTTNEIRTNVSTNLTSKYSVSLKEPTEYTLKYE